MTQVEREIQFNEERHEYRVDGIIQPSVTTILRLSGLADFSAIPERIKAFVLARGKAAHRAGHYLLESDLDEATLDPEIVPRIEALKKFLFHSGFRPRPGMIEQAIYNPTHRFAGTYDVVGALPAINWQDAMIDWSCGDTEMAGKRYQTAAYLLSVPGVYHRAGIQLKADRNFSVTTYPPSTLLRDQQTFLDALGDLRRKGIL